MFQTPEQNCTCCKKGTLIHVNGNIICTKFGVIEPVRECRYFEFDPIKRIPHPRDPKKLGYTDADFSVD